MEQLDFSSVRVPAGGDRVYKDECVYSFDTPESAGGLYVSLSSFLGVGRPFLQLHYSKTKERFYLHIKRTLKPPAEAPPSSDEAPPSKKPTRMAIGVEGGFDGGVVKREYQEELALVVLPEETIIPLPPSIPLPELVQRSIAGVQAAHTASKQEAIAAWDGEKRPLSKHADNLKQLDNGIQIPPSGWKCEQCDLTTNLWLNLTDGSVLCGRKYFDGSGGNNHAVDHWQTARHPLAVKLGTITPDGADVFSYNEDEMVEDPHLRQHLAHFGIDITSMTKTDATMTELEIDINMRIGEWSIIQESGKQLRPVYGAGYTGLTNLGNSCYVNSIMQVLFSLPEFKQRYYDCSQSILEDAPGNPTNHFNAQMSKLAVGLLSGEHSKPPEAAATEPGAEEKGQQGRDQKGIPPSMFKALIGRGHREFGSMRQQDAQEFLLYLLSEIDHSQRAHSGAPNPVDVFRFQLEERVECVMSGRVRYSTREDLILCLPVPMETATNRAEVEVWEAKKKELEEKKERIKQDEVVRAKVPFASCLESFASAHEVADFYSTALSAKSLATKTTRFATFPDYLVIQMVKFTFGKDWVPKKYDVLIDAPDELDLTALKAHGLLATEKELPEGDAPGNQQQQAAGKPVELDEGVVIQLVSMGFDMEGCKRAVFNTDNQGVEPAMNWVLEHMGDADFATPFQPPAPRNPASSGPAPSEENVVMVMSLGFSREQAVKALQATNDNVERAADWVFSHAGELDAMETNQPQDQGPTNMRTGVGKYELVAFVSHMGTSTMCGHYVCHIKKDGQWVIFNDEKVALSEAPPKEHAYLYLYRRSSAA